MDDKELKKEIISITMPFIVSITMFILADIFFRLVTWNSYNPEPYTLRFAMFFGIVIYTLIWGLTKKSARATLICYLSIFILSIINELKILFTREPIYFSDVNFLSQSGDLLNLVTQNVSSTFVLKFMIICTVYFGILGVISIINFKYNLEIKNKKVRLVILIIDIIILILLFCPTNYTKELYLKLFYNTDNYVDFDSYTTNLSFYQRNGFINGMYGIALNNKFMKPQNYDDETLNNMLREEEVNVNTKKIEEKPNIIVIFSEAFWDIDQLEEIEFDKPITSNFNKLKNEGEFVNLISPTYGGMSENVAFEFVTGGSMNYFPKGYIPIMSLYSRKNSEEIPSLVKVLNNNGYTSEIVFGKDYYNSRSAYLKIGFNNYTELVEDGQTSVSDEYCTDLLIKKLDEKKSGEPLFYLLETIESHMPYPADKYASYDIDITKSEYDDNVNTVLRSYAQGIYNADEQLGRLYEYVKNYDEPTVLIFLGDHLPFLYTENNENVINKLKYFNTDDENLNDYRLYNTQCLIVSNLDEKIELNDYLGVDMVLNGVINQLDIENESYYKWLYNSSDTLAGSNRYVSFDSSGNLYSTDELEDEMKRVYENKNLMQYKFFINN